MLPKLCLPQWLKKSMKGSIPGLGGFRMRLGGEEYAEDTTSGALERRKLTAEDLTGRDSQARTLAHTAPTALKLCGAPQGADGSSWSPAMPSSAAAPGWRSGPGPVRGTAEHPGSRL